VSVQALPSFKAAISKDESEIDYELTLNNPEDDVLQAHTRDQPASEASSRQVIVRSSGTFSDVLGPDRVRVWALWG
jgi:hypothetical protein